MGLLSVWSYQIKLEMFRVRYSTRRNGCSSRERSSDKQNLRITLSKLTGLFDMCQCVPAHFCNLLWWGYVSSEQWRQFNETLSVTGGSALALSGYDCLLVCTVPPAVSTRSRVCCWSCDPQRPLPPKTQKLSGGLNWLIKYSQICKHTVECWSVLNCKCYGGNFT